MNKNMKKALAAAAVGAAAGVAVKKMRDSRKEQEDARISAIEEAVMNNREYGDRKAYLVGGGLASMAAAAYLVRDCRFPCKVFLFPSAPAVGAELAGGDTDGFHQVIQPVVTQGGEPQALADFLNHLFVIGAVRVRVSV